jgi:hypothetical protein
MSGFLKIGLILFLLATGGRVFCLPLPGKDSLKTKFDLNDPRNPDCPCHKYQKQADKEYEALLAGEKGIKSYGSFDFKLPQWKGEPLHFRNWKSRRRHRFRKKIHTTRCSTW